VETSSSGVIPSAVNSGDHTAVQNAVSLDHRGEKTVAKVLVSMKIFPSDVTVDLKMLKEKIQRELPEGTSVIQFAEEPVAFGLVALIAHVTVPEDKPGVLDEVENKLRKIDEVNNVETFMMRRW